MSKIKLVALTILVMLILIAGGTEAYASSTILPQQGRNTETPTELTDEEYLKDVTEFYEKHPELEIVVDLVNPNGIDPALLPEDLKDLAGSGVNVVAYRETARVEASGKPSGLGIPCPLPELNISCAAVDGTRDLTTSKVFGSVTQYARTIALRYDWYSGCSQNCFGWEVEKQYMWWTRSISSWNVRNGVMRTFINGQNYCTEADAVLNYGSSTVAQPTWSGNQTSKYSISGFPNTAYVASIAGFSYTQGDIYQGTTLKYNDARNNQYWPLY